MAQTTGPVLALGAITVVNRTIFNDKSMDWRIPIATGLAAVVFIGAEKLWAEGATALAWTAVVAVCLTRIDPGIPSPAESALRWWDNEVPAQARGAGGRAGRAG